MTGRGYGYADPEAVYRARHVARNAGAILRNRTLPAGAVNEVAKAYAASMGLPPAVLLESRDTVLRDLYALRDKLAAAGPRQNERVVVDRGEIQRLHPPYDPRTVGRD